MQNLPSLSWVQDALVPTHSTTSWHSRQPPVSGAQMYGESCWKPGLHLTTWQRARPASRTHVVSAVFGKTSSQFTSQPPQASRFT
ncbi:MAG: hypothetical protein U1F43_23215 [Myxococcota bacterium]